MDTITATDTIKKIISAKKIEDILDIKNIKSDYRAIMQLIHPDICKDKKATEATAKINELMNYYESGGSFVDEVGAYRTNGYWVDFVGDSDMLKWSFDNYNRFMGLKDADDKQFQKYLPISSEILSDGTYRFNFDKRAIPLSNIELPQEHVNWILNRLLEYSTYLSQKGFVHCGLNPESVFIVPETHGIQIASFYHLTKIDCRVKTISGKYVSWYPPKLLTEKIATPTIDLELSKKISIYLLGDKSGSGIKLKKTHNEKFIDFAVKQHTNAYECVTEYKQLLRDNFKKEFHLLNL